MTRRLASLLTPLARGATVLAFSNEYSMLADDEVRCDGHRSSSIKGKVR